MYHRNQPPVASSATSSTNSNAAPSALPAFSHPHSGIRTPPNGASPHASPYATPAPLFGSGTHYPYPPPMPTSMSRQSSAGLGAWSPVNSATPNAVYATGHRTSNSATGVKREGRFGSNGDDEEEEEDEEDDDDDDDDEEGDEDGDDDDDDDDDEDRGAEGEEDEAGGSRKRKRNRPSNRGEDASPSTSKTGMSPGDGDMSGQISPHKKAKPPRGSKACTHCRKLKMRCTGGENGPPCDRCRHSGYQCIFEESNRGKKAAANAAAAARARAEKAATQALQAGKNKAEQQQPQQPESLMSGFPSSSIKGKGKQKQSNQDLARSLEKMEQTLHTVLRSIRDPTHASSLGHASGMLTRPQSPDGQHRQSMQHPASDHSAVPVPPTSIAPSQLTSTGESSDTHSARYASIASASAGAMPAPSSVSFRDANTGRRGHRATSPRLHSLPPDSLNPLGLLAEASLGNQLGAARKTKQSASASESNAQSGYAAGQADSSGPPVDSKGTRPGNAAEDGSNEEKVAGDSQHAKERRGSLTGGNGTPALGVASKTYFRPGPMSMLPLRKVIIDRELPPELLTSGTVSDEEVLDLFSIFFHNCAQHIILLDPEWHTPQFVCGRSPFLFTVILAIASRYYTRRPDLHIKCLRQATKEAFSCLERGFKSVEIVQAFLLLTMWGQPARRFEEDKTWIFAGIAFRVATDLNLHRKSIAALPGNHNVSDPGVLEREKEIRNRERTWIFCFVVDRSLSSQMGKPSVIREDFILRNTRSWALHRMAQPADMALSAIVELQRLTSRHSDLLYSSVTSVTGLNHDLDFSSMIRIFSEQLEEWRSFWTFRGLSTGDCHQRHPAIPPPDGTLSPREVEIRDLFAAAARESPPPEDADHTMRTLYYLIQQAPLRFHYASLSLHSFGLQFGSQMDRGLQFLRCYDAAKGIFFAARDGMRPILRYASDTQILIISFSLVFMLKLTRPQFARFADCEEIFDIVEQGADLLEEVAASPMHTPALYGHFLRSTLSHARADHRARSTGAYPSRAASPGDGAAHRNGGNAASGDGYEGPSASAAFDLPSDAALGSVGNDPSLAPAAAGSTRNNSMTDPSLAHAFTSAAASNGTGGFNLATFLGSGAHGAGYSMTSGASSGGNAGLGVGTGGGMSGSGGSGMGQQGDAGGLMLDNVWWNQLVPSGLGGPLDGLNGGIDMQPLIDAHIEEGQGDGTSGSHEDESGEGKVGSAGAEGKATTEGMDGSQGPGEGLDNTKSTSVPVSGANPGSGGNAAHNGGGAGTGVTRPSSPSGNMINQFGGNFLSLDFSHGIS